MTDYYNEINPEAASWLRGLIEAGQLAPGIVDERSIEDVYPSDLRGFTQCHFFAGIGIWPYALRKAGWPSDRPIWSGSCPCQPFSTAGKGTGFDDERHLWPAFHHLIKECKPPSIAGEQVASKAVEPWIDLVQLDLEALGYAFGCVPFPSSCVGAPHIRDRAYWMAHSQQHDSGSQAKPANHGKSQGDRPANWAGRCGVLSGGLADMHSDGCKQGSEGSKAMGHRQAAGADCGLGGVADTANTGSSEGWVFGIGEQRLHQKSGCGLRDAGNGEWPSEAAALAYRPSPTNGFWRDADWLGCRDGKWRPVEPGTFPLANGLPASMGAMSPELQRLAELAGLSKDSLKRAKKYRVEALRGYGNAINAVQAQAFIEVAMEVMA